MPSRAVPTCPDKLYNQLTTLLSASSTRIHEIAILPSSSHPTIQHDPASTPPACGIPKSLLLSCFLRARSVFHSAASDPEYEAATTSDLWLATSVILLWEPNYLTAANWRKRQCVKEERGNPSELISSHSERHQVLNSELLFLTSLLTSPLFQQAKSSMLWAHRLWVLRQSPPSRDVESVVVEDVWREELRVVMAAGERHARNYHAWEHARQVLRLVVGIRPEVSESEQHGRLSHGSEENLEQRLLTETVGVVHKWCLMHPGDVSGWAFLVFLLRTMNNGEWKLEAAKQDAINKVVEDTRSFVTKYLWKGKSVAWFLMAVGPAPCPQR